jgi:hypothetical protein
VLDPALPALPLPGDFDRFAVAFAALFTGVLTFTVFFSFTAGFGATAGLASTERPIPIFPGSSVPAALD